MSKYPFFDKKGRPSSYEAGICKKINKLLNEGGISQADINRYKKENGGNLPSNKDELEYFYSQLTGENLSEAQSDNNHSFDDTEDGLGEDDFNLSDETSAEELVNELDEEGFDFSQKNPDAVDFDPFEAPVITEGREYTKGILPNQEAESKPINESDVKEESFFNEEDFERPLDDEEEEDIPEPIWSNTQQEDENTEGEEDGGEGADFSSSSGDKLGGDNLQDLSPQQKRKSAEKTAEAIMQMYCKFVPLPFIKMASFNETKIQKMAYEGKIDMNMPLEKNVNVRQFIEGTNEQVEQIFTVTQEQKEEIKDPLIDVLMEQELALTPTQRLMMAVGGHLVTMGFSAFQLMQNNKVSLEAFERYHQEMKPNSRPVSSPPPRPAQASSVKFTDKAPKENFSDFETDSIRTIIEQMEGDVIDPNHDPSVDVSEGYED